MDLGEREKAKVHGGPWERQKGKVYREPWEEIAKVHGEPWRRGIDEGPPWTSGDKKREGPL